MDKNPQRSSGGRKRKDQFLLAACFPQQQLHEAEKEFMSLM